MNIAEEAKKNYEYAVGIRRYLHEHPEPSGEEEKTAEFIAAELEKLGIEHVIVPDGGVIGRIYGAKPEKTVLLRADMDALPIQESEENLGHKKVCVSKNPGVCHACGHDAHTAMLLAEARILKEHCDELNGDIVLMFERGEEYGGQVRNLLPYLIEKLQVHVDTCMATHVKWDVDTGKISAQPGAVMSGGYGFTIRIVGHGGHGSRPDLACSPIDCFNAICCHMNLLRMTQVAPSEILTFSIGTVESGTARNVIPEDLTFGGTIRTFNVEGAGEPFVKKFLQIVERECELFGCTYEIVNMKKPLFECSNDPVCSRIAQDAVKKYLGEDALTAAEPWMASESMQAYLKLWPGVFTFTGIRSETVGSGANHHTPEFDLDEKGMLYGITAAVGYAVEFLNYKEEIPFRAYAGTLKELVNRNL